MAKYINKDDVIAEIERRIFEDYNSGDEEMEEVDEAVKGALASLSYFIDTLEVKEVKEMEEEVMEAPVNIYIQPNAHDGWFEGNKPNDNFVEYIRKDALLKYLRNEFNIVDFHLKAQDDPVWWGQRNAFQQVIDKIIDMTREKKGGIV